MADILLCSCTTMPSNFLTGQSRPSDLTPNHFPTSAPRTCLQLTGLFPEPSIHRPHPPQLKPCRLHNPAETLSLPEAFLTCHLELMDSFYAQKHFIPISHKLLRHAPLYHVVTYKSLFFRCKLLKKRSVTIVRLVAKKGVLQS